MILSSHMLVKVETGQKSAILLPATAKDRYRVGRRYSLRRQGDRASVWVRVTEVRDVALERLSEDDCRRLGFRNMTKVTDAFRERYGRQDTVLVRFERTEPPARFLAQTGRGSDYTNDRSKAIDTAEVADLAFVQYLADRAHESRPRRIRKPSARSVVEDAVKRTLRDQYRGWHVDEVAEHAPQLGSVAEIRLLRRSMGLREVDGLPRGTQAERDERLRRLVEAGASVREVALLMDCSVGKAHALMRSVKDDDNGEEAA